MLTDPSARPCARQQRRRRRAIVVAIAPTARVAHLGPVALTALLGGLPAAVTVIRGGTELAVPLVIAGLATGAALGWAADDPTADVLTPLPIPTSARTWLRVLCTAAVTTACVGVLAVVVVSAGPGLPPDWLDRFPEATAAAAGGLAVGLTAVRRGERSVGAVAVTAGFLIPAFVAALATRWPGALPTFASGEVHAHWWVVAALAAALAARSGRDPARPVA